MSTTKTIVSIGGKQYTLCGSESAEYIHRVALKVNSKIEDMKASHPSIPNIDLAMLTAINLADDYIKLYDELEQVRRELEAAHKELEGFRKVQPLKPVNPPTGSGGGGGGKIKPLKK